MWINRAISHCLEEETGSFIQILIGPRQCGKSSLFTHLGGEKWKETTFDDLQARHLANKDPKLFLSQLGRLNILDEVQYVPNLFPQLKQIVDQHKKEGKKPEVLFRLTGSNQILMDKNIKETLVGRASYFYLNTLSISEIKAALPDIGIDQIMFFGGWPELYTNTELNSVRYLNDYIRNYIEKDIILSAGIEKQQEFNTYLGLVAGHCGDILNLTKLSNRSNIKSVTAKEWLSTLERIKLIHILKPYSSDLNKRLIKSPKVHFMDTGLALRLQGWSEKEPFLRSPQTGKVFESLVCSEIVKYMKNKAKNWSLYHFRTKEREEIDFIIKNGRGDVLALDAKLAIQSASARSIPPSAKKCFPNLKSLLLVTFGGKEQFISETCQQVPIEKLASHLEKF